MLAASWSDASQSAMNVVCMLVGGPAKPESLESKVATSTLSYTCKPAPMQMVALCIREDCCSNDTIIFEQETNCSANNVEPLLLSNYNRIIMITDVAIFPLLLYFRR